MDDSACQKMGFVWFRLLGEFTAVDTHHIFLCERTEHDETLVFLGQLQNDVFFQPAGARGAIHSKIGPVCWAM